MSLMAERPFHYLVIFGGHARVHLTMPSLPPPSTLNVFPPHMTCFYLFSLSFFVSSYNHFPSMPVTFFAPCFRYPFSRNPSSVDPRPNRHTNQFKLFISASDPKPLHSRSLRLNPSSVCNHFRIQNPTAPAQRFSNPQSKLPLALCPYPFVLSLSGPK